MIEDADDARIIRAEQTQYGYEQPHGDLEQE